jgi:hypothetical protein
MLISLPSGPPSLVSVSPNVKSNQRGEVLPVRGRLAGRPC